MDFRFKSTCIARVAVPAMALFALLAGLALIPVASAGAATPFGPPAPAASAAAPAGPESPEDPTETPEPPQANPPASEPPATGPTPPADRRPDRGASNDRGTDRKVPADSDTGGIAVEDSGADSSDSSDSAEPLEVTPLTVPNFLIDRFEIPPFLLPIYQACGTEYGIPWTVLAAINRIETGFGTNLNVSSAGALGWMQFIPSTWASYGVDANGDGNKDPYNPVDAICSAANYLKAAGYADSPRKGIFAYNHADWYVDDILQHSALYEKIPVEMLSALTGLTEGARFPVAAEADYAGQLSTRQARRQGLEPGDVESAAGRRSIEITAEGGSPVIAVNDGVVKEIDRTTGTVTLADAYGNRYIYSGLGTVADVHPVPRERQADNEPAAAGDEAGSDNGPAVDDDMGAAKATDSPDDADRGEAADAADATDISETKVDPAAAAAAEDGDDAPVQTAEARRAEQESLSGEESAGADSSENARGRVYANPLRPRNQRRSTVDGRSVKDPDGSGGNADGVKGRPGDYVIYDGSQAGIYRFNRRVAKLRPLEQGSRVIAGTVLGRLAETGSRASIEFAIRPGGEDAPKIDPKPFLDGWRLLAATNIYNARGANRFAERLGVGGVLLLSKPALQKRLLADDGLEIYSCGREDIASGFTDRRILAMLAFLRERGFTMTITSLTCGHSVNTSSGNLSHHTTGTAVDIAVFNGEVVTSATQGPGTNIDRAARAVMSLQGTMRPNQVISLTDYNNGIGFAMGDHNDHLHVGYSPDPQVAGETRGGLGNRQWRRLIERLGEIENPDVPTAPSQNSIPADRPGRDR